MVSGADEIVKSVGKIESNFFHSIGIETVALSVGLNEYTDAMVLPLAF
jgi:hypothetical protein